MAKKTRKQWKRMYHDLELEMLVLCEQYARLCEEHQRVLLDLSVANEVLDNNGVNLYKQLEK